MKSYLRFLSRNKLYTVVMAVGLSVSKAFVLLLANVVINDLSYDRMIKDDGKTQYIHTPDGSFRQDINPITARSN